MKAILILDMPEKCTLCDLCNFGSATCCADGSDIEEEMSNGTKPSWCPLKPMPQPREMTNADSSNPWIDENAIGFNECLAEILGEEE